MKEPTLREKLTKWWKDDNGKWFKILEYNPDLSKDNYSGLNITGLSDSYFIGRESADIPEEL